MNEPAIQPTAIDLFSGAGGLTLGLKKAGFRVLAAVEIEPLAVETYRMNHPEVKVFSKNIRWLTCKRVMQELNIKPGELDLLAGCPPCQGFSTVRTRNKKSSVFDPRNELIFEFMRFVKRLRPKTVMLENVPGLAKDERFHHFCAKLERMKYLMNPAVLDASKYGVPQRRERLIMIAAKGKKIELGAEDNKILTVKDALRDIDETMNQDPLHNKTEKRDPHIMELIRFVPKNGGSRLDLPEKYHLECHKKTNGFKDVYGRMSWDKVAPTITGVCNNPSKGRFLHPTEDRAITLREAALLQGFPQDYKFSLKRGKGKVALMIGNALPPEFIRRHGLKIIEHLENA
ncbi:Modification methylase MthTI [uncultured archaeon]|nr:Modification methylase MthTI [uncultured archaeon]